MATIAFPSLARDHTIPGSQHRYTYVYSPPRASTSNPFPTLLFLHGFPSSSYDWRHQIAFFVEKGYGVLVPDLLGYGQSTTGDNDSDSNLTQSTELSHYKAKIMSTDVIALLDHENISGPVHAVGHDMGCYLLSKMVNYYPTRFASLSFLAVPYHKPAERFDVDAINQMMKDYIGFEKYGYLKLFESDEAAGLIEEHMESFFTLFYTAEGDLWIEHLGPTGALETWLRNDRKAPLAPYITAEEKATHFKIMRGHYKSVLMWYRALIGNVNLDDEIEAHLDPNVNQPVLMVSQKPSRINPPGVAEMMKLYMENLTVKEVGANGHWLQLEARDEVNQSLLGFLEGL
ncbi:hypothetical protein ACJ72_07151 [Emergomyces africanus]|uniref:AB hydrolase-1 domain-containing protein n=1 Tax=Emergomyces africanus TaxID=1955775 RepID=A0A1B7NP05_9EURO|nr:hypothetical protein ACJ72_07151 [Emergomyces africanus]